MVPWAYFKTKIENVDACPDLQIRFVSEKSEKKSVFQKIKFFLQKCFLLKFFSEHPDDHPELLKN